MQTRQLKLPARLQRKLLQVLDKLQAIPIPKEGSPPEVMAGFARDIQAGQKLARNLIAALEPSRCDPTQYDVWKREHRDETQRSIDEATAWLNRRESQTWRPAQEAQRASR